MKDIHKNPILYYILVPVLIFLWPLLISTKYLPKAEDALDKEVKDYSSAIDIMDEILSIDPKRLTLSGSKSEASGFDYLVAINKVANSYGISEANCSINTKPAVSKNNQKTQNASVSLEKIDIENFAKFLSTLQLRWANLECEKLKLTKKKGLSDAWKVDLNFKYYYQ